MLHTCYLSFVHVQALISVNYLLAISQMVDEDQCRQFKEQMNTKLMTPALMLMFGILLMILGIVYWLFYLIDLALYITTALIALLIGLPFFFWPFFCMVQKVQHIKRIHNVLAFDSSKETMSMRVLSLNEIKAKWKEYTNALVERYQHFHGNGTSNDNDYSESLALDYISMDDFLDYLRIEKDESRQYGYVIHTLGEMTTLRVQAFVQPEIEKRVRQ